jgi:HD superfamily phosphodiesterase
MDIIQSKKKNKRLTAIFKTGEKIDFGLKGGNTYIEHKDKKKRENYIKRHQVNEDFNNPKTAGALSRWILWGDSTNIDKNISDFKKKFI